MNRMIKWCIATEVGVGSQVYIVEQGPPGGEDVLHKGSIVELQQCAQDNEGDYLGLWDGATVSMDGGRYEMPLQLLRPVLMPEEEYEEHLTRYLEDNPVTEKMEKALAEAEKEASDVGLTARS